MATTDFEELIPKEAEAGIDRIQAKMDTLVKTTLKLGEAVRGMAGVDTGGNLSASNKKAAENAQVQDKIIVSAREYKTVLKELETAQIAEKMAIQATNAALKDEIKFHAANANSLEKARAYVKVLTNERNKLNLATDEGKKKLVELNTVIDKNNAFIKENVDQYTKQKINIGNYSGALGILETELTKVRKLIEDNTKAGNDNNAMLERWQKEEALLTQLVNNQAAGFASATGELRNNEKALQALGAAGLQQTEFYQKLLKETAELKDNVGDLKAEIKNLASDTSLLDGAVETAGALAGAYGIAAASSELFGFNTEELQKTMVKLQAVQTIIIGLQSIQNALQRESSAMLFLNTVATKAAAVAQTIFTFATGAATTALRLYRAALIATGIGALVALLGTAAAAMDTYASSVGDATEDIEKQNEELEKNKQLLEDTATAAEKARNAKKGGLDDMKRELDILKAKGATDKEVFEQEQRIRERELRNLRVRQATGLAVSKEGLDKQNEIEAAKLEFARTQEEKAKKIYDKALEDQRKRLEERKKTADQELKLNYEVGAKELEFQADKLTDITEDETLSYEQRIEALGKYFQIRITLAKAAAELEKNTGTKSAAEIKAIELKLATELAAISYGVQKTNSKINAKKLKDDKDTLDQMKQNLKDMSDFAKEQDKERLKENEEYEKDIKNLRKQAAFDLVNAVGDVGGSLYERQLQQQDRLLKNLELEKEKKINLINAEAVSQEEKTRRIAAVELEAAKQAEVIEARKRKIQREQAQFEKAASIASIVAKTAEAMIGALKIPVYGAALAAGYAAIGAVQLAKVIATPIPQYANETPAGGHPKDGLALVGEGPKDEVVFTNGRAYLATEPTFMNLNRGDHVKHLDNVSNQLLYPNMLSMKQSGADITAAFGKHTDKVMFGLKQVANTIERQKPASFRVIGSEWSQYLNRKL